MIVVTYLICNYDDEQFQQGQSTHSLHIVLGADAVNGITGHINRGIAMLIVIN